MKTICCLIILTLAVASAQATPMPDGHYNGTITLPGTQLEIAVDLKSPAKSGDAWSGTIDIPVQSLRGYGLGDVKIDSTRVKFKMPNIPGIRCLMAS